MLRQCVCALFLVGKTGYGSPTALFLSLKKADGTSTYAPRYKLLASLVVCSLLARNTIISCDSFGSCLDTHINKTIGKR
jgi:hypothetical protein